MVESGKESIIVRKAWIVMWLALAGVGAWGADKNPYNGTELVGRFDRAEPFYKAGETATFTLSFENNRKDKSFDYSKHTIRFTREGDDGRKVGKTIPMSEMPFVFKDTLAKPGFVRYQAYLHDENGRKCAYSHSYSGSYHPFFDGGAGFSVEDMQGVPEPEDFDAFWAEQRARLDKVPVLAHRVDAVPQYTNKLTRPFAVEIMCQGVMPVTGYLWIPKDALEGRKKYPVQVEFAGYGFGPVRCGGWQMDKRHKDKIYFTINAHGQKLPEFGGDKKSLRAHQWNVGTKNGKLENYAFNAWESCNRDLAYFNGMALRVMRALDYVKTLPEWNGKDLWVRGGSQGGLQAVWAAGLDKDVTKMDTFITWCCDLGGVTLGRMSGWRMEWKAPLAYFDPVNHAKRISKNCESTISKAGLGDYCSPPGGLAIVWNNIPGPKKIVWAQGATHNYSPPRKEYYTTWEKGIK